MALQRFVLLIEIDTSQLADVVRAVPGPLLIPAFEADADDEAILQVRYQRAVRDHRRLAG